MEIDPGLAGLLCFRRPSPTLGTTLTTTKLGVKQPAITKTQFFSAGIMCQWLFVSPVRIVCHCTKYEFLLHLFSTTVKYNPTLVLTYGLVFGGFRCVCVQTYPGGCGFLQVNQSSLTIPWGITAFTPFLRSKKFQFEAKQCNAMLCGYISWWVYLKELIGFRHISAVATLRSRLFVQAPFVQ